MIQALEIETNSGVVVNPPGVTKNDACYVTGKYASLERNQWLLYGTYDLIDKTDPFQEAGWWSEQISGPDCTFSENPWIRYTFPDDVNTFGWTFFFDGTADSCVSELKIIVYDADEAAIFEQTYYPTGPQFRILEHLEGYRSVRLEFIKTTVPFRRVRLLELSEVNRPMIETSPSYAPYTAVRRVGARVNFSVVDATANVATTETNSTDIVSSPEVTKNAVNYVTGKYASLERNQWLLDGTYDLIDSTDPFQEAGWWSEQISGADCTFSENPWIRYTFPDDVDTFGWTVFFDTLTNEYASKFKLTIYDADDSVRFERIYHPTGAQFRILERLEGYRAIRLEFIKTSAPFRRVRLSEFMRGVLEDLTNDDLIDVSFVHGIDLVSSTLPSKEMTFTFNNYDRRYNLLDPNVVYEFLQRGQEVVTHLIINGEAIPMGKYSFTSLVSSDSVLNPKVQCNDIVYRLDGEKMSIGANQEITLEEAVAEILSGFNVRTEFRGDVAGRKVCKAYPTQRTRREMLQLVAQASMCNVWADRDNVLIFEELVIDVIPADTISKDELYSNGGVSIGEYVEAVKLIVENKYISDESSVSYTVGSGENVKTVENPCVVPSNGYAVAQWLFDRYGFRKKYAVQNRGNPAVEVGYTQKIYDAFDYGGLALVTGLKYDFKQSIKCVTTAVGQ